MHKKLEAELIYLAHQILKIDNTTDINALRDKARIIYENLSVLSFVDNYFIETPAVTDSKEDFLEELNNLTSKKIVDKKIKEEKIVEKSTSEPKKEIESKEEIEIDSKKEEVPVKKTTEKEQTKQLVDQTVKTIKTEAKEIAAKIQQKPETIEKKTSLDEEMKDSIPADVAANMFEKAATPKEETINVPKSEEKQVKKSLKEIFAESKSLVEKAKVNVATKHTVPATPAPKASINDRVFNQKIQVGLNDRIAFVKHLFNFSQEDFNRVLSQLNSFETEQECKSFINTQVKPEYDWSNKEEYEERLIALIERKFK